MDCPGCNTANADTAKFCQECGTPLSLSCPGCGMQLAVGAKFCVECGRSTSGAQPAPPQDRLQQYIPAELLAKLDAARASGIEGERRVVTMLFCDVTGSTAAAERMDPEEWHEIMNGAFPHLIEPVYRYEGTLARLMGDAVLAFFGAPIAHEDDPVRAVQAGLDIVDQLGPHRADVKERWDLDLDVRIGINTGLVVVGEVGSDLRMEYTAMGDAINVAARMEQTAAPGTVQIGADTHRLIAPWFTVSGPESIAVKGKSDPIDAYRVHGRKADTATLRGIEGHEAPLIGRDAEAQALRGALSELSGGAGGIVCLVGDAGLGKTRLIGDARGAFEVLHEAGYWYETASLSYETAQPYAAFQRLTRRVAGVEQHDGPDAIRDKIASLVEVLDADRRDSSRQVLETLLGLAGESRIEGETFKGLLFETALALWRRMADRQPIVLVFDDLHWADPASVELLVHLMQLVEQVPLLLVCAMRPERTARGWEARLAAEDSYPEQLIEIALQPLSEADSDHLVDHLLTVADLPAGLRASILSRAEGNPFFVEEVVRTLIDRGAIARDEELDRWVVAEPAAAAIDLPDNVQALLVARIDRLDEAARSALQMASVIGRTFQRSVIERVAGQEAGLDLRLAELERADMIRETSPAPDAEYAFRHTLTQEAAYGTMLLRRRRDYHGRVGEALEALFPERLEDLASRLADHFAEARRPDRALKYHTLAGDVAFRLHANAEAASHYTGAIAIALELDATDPLLHLYVNRGRALELDNSFDEAIDNYEEMVALADRRAEPRLELGALAARATVYATQTPKFNPDRAGADSGRALQLARELGDRAAEARVLWNQMLFHMHGVVEPASAVELGEESLALARQLGLREQTAYTLSDLGWAYGGVRELDRAAATLAEARPLWRELGNLPMLANNLSVSSMPAYLLGDYQGVLTCSGEASRISRSIGNTWGQWSSVTPMCQAYLELGEAGKALDSAQEAASLSEEAGLWLQRPYSLALQCWAYATLGTVELGRPSYVALLESELDAVPEVTRPMMLALRAMFEIADGDLAAAGDATSEALAGIDLSNFAYPTPIFVLLAGCQLALARCEYHEAIEAADEMVAILKGAGARTFAYDAMHVKGRALAALGRHDEARESLVAARAAAESVGSRRGLWPVLYTLSRAEARRGNVDEANALTAQARETVTYIADRAGTEELRSAFLRSPAVRDIM